MSKVIAFLRKNWVAIVGALAGLALGVVGSYIDKFYLDRPDLSVEINSIEKKVPDNFTLPPEQNKLIQDMGELLFTDDPVTNLKEYYVSSEDGKFRMEDLDKILEVLKDKRDREFQRDIEKHASFLKQLNSLRPGSAARELPREFLYSVDIGPSDILTETARQALIDNSESAVRTLETQRSEYARRLPELEQTLARIKENLSTIEVSTVVVNLGKSGVSLKSQALLRVQIGDNNFIELPMRMLDFDSKSEIPTQGARVIRFASRQMDDLEREDKDAVHRYWGQAVQSTLFLLDIFNQTHKTKAIVFSSGLYEKNTYNHLKEASKRN